MTHVYNVLQENLHKLTDYRIRKTGQGIYSKSQTNWFKKQAWHGIFVYQLASV